MKPFIILVILVSIIGCKQKQTYEFEKFTNVDDYNTYLNTNNTPSLDEANLQQQFWSGRLDKDTTGIGDIGQLANAYELLFAETGAMEHLLTAENLYKKAITIAAPNFKDGFERSLAKNYISQHRFKEANELLQKSFEGVSVKRPTKLMLFDAAMELGDYERAYNYLSNLKDMSDYNYLIRLSKWSDHKGDLDSAIKYMEMAKEKAESNGSKSLKIWTYSNLADYYGHAGRIQDSYQHYLMTLQLQPDNSYVKRKIAWIVYAAEGDAEESHRILDSVMKNHQLPDYYLLKAELYAFQGDDAAAQNAEEKFVSTVLKGNYGAMYNTYLIELYAEDAPKKALKIAEIEKANRSTPLINSYLAFAHLKNGNKAEALSITESEVEGKTFEPVALYHNALVYKANGNSKKVKEIKAELEEATFEIGPLMTYKVAEL